MHGCNGFWEGNDVFSRESFLDRRVQTTRREDEEASPIIPKS